MPVPTQSQVHIDQPLTNLVEWYRQKLTDYVSMNVFPGVPVEHKSNDYFRWSRFDLLRDSMKQRAPGALVEMGGVGLDTATYSANRWDLGYPIADDIRANADPMLNLEYVGTEYLTTQAMINREVSWATAYFNASAGWGTTVVGASSTSAGQVKYWDTDGSDPVLDVLEGIATVKESTGYDVNKIVLGYRVKKALKTNALIIDRLKYGQTAPGPVLVKDSDLAQLFEVEQVMTMGAPKTTSAEGAVSQTTAFIGGNNALLCYAAPSPGLMVASAGYTFNWRGLEGATANGWRIKKYRDERIESDIIEIRQAYVQKLVAPDLGYFLSEVLQP